MTRFLLTLAVVASTLLFSLVPAGPRAAAPALPVLTLTTASASTASVLVWNKLCTQWEFPPCPAGQGASFAQVWNCGAHTLTYAEAISGITADMNQILGSSMPPPSGDESFNATIIGWE
jgi:hypothetical protein